MKSLRDIHIILIILLLVVSCARQSSPSGGPVDETPPQVIRSMPENGTVNFGGNGFDVTFNEYIVLKEIDQKLLVSPPLENKPLVKIKGKTLMVTFDEELRDSATYTFYFQDAIQDLNEGNAAENYQYVFATGPTLDSLSVTGKIYKGDDLEPVKGVFVLLYHGTADTLPRKTMPDYVTRASDDGNFRIDHLSEGTYTIYGLTDGNNNKKYDLDDELFAFADSSIVISPYNNFIPAYPDSLISGADSVRYTRIPGREYSLYLFKGPGKTQYLKGSNREEGYNLRFVFALPVDPADFNISFPEIDSTEFLVEYSEQRDTIMVWLQDSLVYKKDRIAARIVYPATDSTGVIALKTDTIDLRYFAPRPARGAAVTTDKQFLVTTNASGRKGIIPGGDLWFSFTTPVNNPDTSLLKLYRRADTLLVEQEYAIISDSLKNRRYIFKGDFMQDSSYLLIADRGAFTDIYGHQNDSVSYNFKVRNAESFGSLGINLSGYNGQVILHLLTADEKLVAKRVLSLENQTMVRFPYLEPGSYRVKLIYDLDKNGAFTSGDFDLKRQPEPVTYYPEQFDIKALWTIEQDWRISSIREKSEMLRNPITKKPAQQGAAASR